VQLFEPFYTTKANGLGQELSICKSIVQQHGGAIFARSESNDGTTFHFELPTHQRPD
jgi:signal transduction histidine kinase